MTALATLAEVSVTTKIRRTETALAISPDLTAEEWETLGRILGEANRASGWWIGDWINYGEGAGYVSRGKYEIAEQLTGLKTQTLRDYAWVARTFESSSRHDDLSFKHHHAVAPRPELERGALLLEAHDNGWSASELRKHAPVTRDASKKNKHNDVLLHAEVLARLAQRWERPMTDALTPPQARKQLTVLSKAAELLAEVIEAVEYRAATPHSFMGR